MHTYTHTHIPHTHIHTYTHTHIHAHTHTHIHPHTHTPTPTPTPTLATLPAVMPAVEEACVGNMNNNIKKAVLFWDWDDTLLCSSALSEKGYRLSTDMKKQNDTELETQLKVRRGLTHE